MSAQSPLKQTVVDRAEINRRNAQKSTGPKTEEGKAKSRRNALKDGLTGRGVVLPAETDEDAVKRREGWLAAHPPKNEIERDVIVAGATATTLLFRCQRELEFARDRAVDRAFAGWEVDRAIEAAELGDKVGRNPAKYAIQLMGSLHGARWAVARWSELASRLAAGADWTDAQRELALDLLGIPASLRDAYSLVDLPNAAPQAVRAHRIAVASRELGKIEDLIEDHLKTLDRDDRERLMAHSVAASDPEVRRLERCERDLARRMMKSIQEIRNFGCVLPAPKPRPAPKPEPPRPPVPVVPPESLDTVLKEVAARPVVRDVDLDIPGMTARQRAEVVRKVLDLDAKLDFLSPADRNEGRELYTALQLRITPDPK